MTRKDIEQRVRAALEEVAPDVDAQEIDAGADLREAAELDSMDVLNLVIALHEAYGVDIPDADAGAFVTIAGAVDYLSSRVPA